MLARRIGYGLLLAAALVLYLFENNGGTRLLLAVLVLLPVIAALLLYLPRARFSVRLSLPDSILRGEAATGSLTLQGPRLLPFRPVLSLLVENRMTGETERLLLPCPYKNGSCTLPLSIRATHCGVLRISVASCRARDGLGLFSRRFPLSAETLLPVRPRPRAVAVSLPDTADFLQDSLQYSTQRPGYDPSETFRIRDYAPGDPIRQIHWKLSEKADRLLVRDFGLPIVEQMLLLMEMTLIDGATVSFSDVDQLLELLCAVSLQLVAQQVPHTLGWQQDGSYVEVQIGSVLEAQQAFDRLLDCRVGQGEQSICSVYSAAHSACAHAHVAVFSGYAAPDLSLLQHGNRVTLLLPQARAAGLATWEQDAVVCPFSDETTHLEL